MLDRLVTLQKKETSEILPFLDFDRRGDGTMPTERFLRLPKEKIEAIRTRSGKGVYKRLLEEASINRIVHDANISRGSFYTYSLKISRICWKGVDLRPGRTAF